MSSLSPRTRRAQPTGACPLCGGPAVPYLRARDRNRAVSDETFAYYRCGRCRSLFLTDVPDDLGRYYPDRYHELPDPVQLDRLAREGSHRIELVHRFAEGGHLVEVGAGAGVFAHQARQAGFDVTAIEMNRRCCDHLEEIVGVRVVCSDAPEAALADLGPSRVVTFWHSLEHLPHPWEALESAAANLEPGGILVVAVPNPDALQLRLLGSRWPHVDAPRHLFLIPARTLVARARDHGLSCELVTTADPGGRFWNRFGWQYGLASPRAGRLAVRVAGTAGALISVALDPLERRGLNGSTYTAVFSKGPS